MRRGIGSVRVRVSVKVKKNEEGRSRERTRRREREDKKEWEKNLSKKRQQEDWPDKRIRIERDKQNIYQARHIYEVGLTSNKARSASFNKPSSEVSL